MSWACNPSFAKSAITVQSIDNGRFSLPAGASPRTIGYLMAIPATIAEFLHLLSQSGLLDQRQLEPSLTQLREAGPLPETPATLASQFVRVGLLTSFQVRQLLNGRCKGFTLGPYRLLDRLGVGAMSTVFLAEDVGKTRRVALKVLLSTRAQEPVCRGRFLREAQVAASLHHPNLVHAYEIESDGAVDFLVMEYIDGVTLHDLVTRHGRLETVR